MLDQRLTNSELVLPWISDCPAVTARRYCAGCDNGTVGCPSSIAARTRGIAEPGQGLKLPAQNDYLAKPFAFEELLARIRAVRRTAEQPTATELTVGDLRLDLLTKVAWRAGRRIELSPREWALLGCSCATPPMY